MSQIKKRNSGEPNVLDDDRTIENENTTEDGFAILDPELDLVVVGGGKCASSTKAASKA